tara:strand:+ start:981 stop:1220 length:240 start_codon:yes stop_codon:yes gene_type:complete
MKCPFCDVTLMTAVIKEECPYCGISLVRMLKRISNHYRNLETSYTSLLSVAQELNDRIEVFEAISAAQEASIEKPDEDY